MTNISQQMVGMITFAAWPEFTRLNERENKKHLVSLFNTIIYTLIYLSFIVGIIYNSYGELIFRWWLGNKVNYDSDIMHIFVIIMVISTYWMSYRNLLMSVNHHMRISWLLSSAAVTEGLFAFIGGRIYGPIGLAIGMLLASVLLPFWFMPYEASKKWKTIKPFKEMLFIIMLLAWISLVPFTKTLSFVNILLLSIVWLLLVKREIKIYD